MTVYDWGGRYWDPKPKNTLYPPQWATFQSCCPNGAVELWDFNSNTPLVGLINGYTFIGTSFTYSKLHGKKAVYFSNLVNSYSAHIDNPDEILRIRGDVTVAFALHLYNYVNPIRIWSCGGYKVGVSASNCTGSITVDAGQTYWTSHHGILISDTYTIDWAPPIGSSGLLVCTRTSDIIRFYWDGVLVGGPSSALITPTDGTGSSNYIYSMPGYGSGTGFSIYAGHAIYNRALSDSEIYIMAQKLRGIV